MKELGAMCHKKLGIIVVLTMLGGITHAVEKDKNAPGFYPDIGLIVNYDDNIHREENNEDSDWYTRINPKLNWVSKFGKHRLDVNAEIDYWRYQKHNNEDSFDRFLLGELNLDISPTLDVNLAAGYSRAHVIRGQDPNAATVKPNRWESWGASGEAIYGRRTNKMQVALLLDHQEIWFLNNGLGGRNHDQNMIKGSVFYNLGPKTQLVADVIRTEFDYDHAYAPIVPAGDAELDSTDMAYLVGINWEATARTSGEFRIGRSEKDMDDSRLTDFSGLTTKLNMKWKPKSYSIVDVLLERSTQETKQSSTSHVVKNQLTVDWEHDLSKLLTLELGGTLENDKWSEIREDDLFDLRLGLKYSLYRWMDVTVGYAFQTRDSNIIGLDYDSNTLSLMVEIFRQESKRPKRTMSP